MDTEQRQRAVYAAFHARDIDAVLAEMADDGLVVSMDVEEH